MKNYIKNTLIFAFLFLYSLESFAQNNEKIFFQTDRDIYIVGEDILVNAFCFSPVSKTFPSKILYVEVFDRENTIVIQKKLEVSNGVVSGSLRLPESIKTDVYFIRAYTNYLKDFDPEIFELRKITCINPLSPPNQIDLEDPKEESKEFNTINSKKANINIKEAQKHYTVSIDTEGTLSGYLLKVYSENYQKIYEIQLSSSHQVDILKSILPTGIVYITLSDDEKDISVRPFYNWPNTLDSIDFEVNKLVFSPREEVKLIIHDKNSYDYISAVIVAKGTLKEREGIIPIDVLNNISLLKSYLSENYSLVNQLRDTIDLYLKKEGKRITQTESFYKQVIAYNDSEIISMPEVVGPIIKGSLIDENNQPVSNERLFLSVFDGNKQFHSTFTNRKGRFYFTLYPNTYLTNRLVVRTAGIDNGKKTKILVDYDYSDEFPELTNVMLDIDTTDKETFEELYINQQINENVSSRLIDENTFNKQFGTPDYLVNISDYIKLPKLEEVFNEIVPHATIKKKNKTSYLSVFDETRNIHYDNPLLLLDFVPIFNMDELLKINPVNVKSIAVINNSYRLGEINYRGIVSVTTKKNNFSEYTFPNDVVFLDFEGVSFPYNFKNINYLEDKSKQSRTPDFRTVLYWNPDVKTDTLSFFTSDYCSDYQIVITGVDKRGNVVKTLQNITVKQ